MYNCFLIWFSNLILPFSITFSTFFSRYQVSWFWVFHPWNISLKHSFVSFSPLFSSVTPMLTLLHSPPIQIFNLWALLISRSLSPSPCLHFCPCPPSIPGSVIRYNHYMQGWCASALHLLSSVPPLSAYPTPGPKIPLSPPALSIFFCSCTQAAKFSHWKWSDGAGEMNCAFIITKL